MMAMAGSRLKVEVVAETEDSCADQYSSLVTFSLFSISREHLKFLKLPLFEGQGYFCTTLHWFSMPNPSFAMSFMNAFAASTGYFVLRSGDASLSGLGGIS